MAYVFELKNIRRGRIKEYVSKYPTAQYFDGQRPWGIPCDIAMPCATQNEVEKHDAEQLLKNGCTCVVEGASNAGGVATSGLEMTQNSMRLKWTAEEVDERLHTIMADIHAACLKYGTEQDGYINYVKGANIAGFMKVANAMVEQGIV